MYDRLPLSIIDVDPEDESVCLGKCFLLSGKQEQILGLLLSEEGDSITIGFPSRCFVGEDEFGEAIYEIVPYTRLPYFKIPLRSTPIIAPLHAEGEYNFYDYIVTSVAIHEDFSTLLEKFGFDPQASCDHYLQRYFKVKEFCKDEKRIEEDEKELLTIPKHKPDIIH